MLRSEQRPVFIIASPGGHLTQAIILTAQVNRRIFITYDDRGKLASEGNVERVLRTIPVRIAKFGHFINALIFAWYFMRHRPRAVVSTGGPFCLPALLIARCMRKPVLYIDTLSRVDGLSNTCSFVVRRRLATRVLSQWAHVAEMSSGVDYVGSIINLRDRGNDADAFHSSV